jgi:hypothetical protein
MSAARPSPTAAAVAAGSSPATLDAASEPILVLNCGSSSIKFALFDAKALPMTRTPLWAGKVAESAAQARAWSRATPSPEATAAHRKGT